MPNILVIVLWRLFNAKHPCSCLALFSCQASLQLQPGIILIPWWNTAQFSFAINLMHLCNSGQFKSFPVLPESKITHLINSQITKILCWIKQLHTYIHTYNSILGINQNFMLNQTVTYIHTYIHITDSIVDPHELSWG